MVIYDPSDEIILEHEIPSFRVYDDETDIFDVYRFSSVITFSEPGQYLLKVYDNDSNNLYVESYFYVIDSGY